MARIIAPKRRVVTLLLLAAVSTATGKVIYVDDDSPADFNNIQVAIDDANDGDVVLVADGLYVGEGNRAIRFMGKAITVRSEDPNDPNVVAATVIDCQHSGRGFSFDSAETSSSVLAGLTITNGSASYGGGICCLDSSSPTIVHCTLIANSATYSGGGIRCADGSSPIVSHCTIVDNLAISGGGISCVAGASPVINCCWIINNSGSGISCSHSNVTVTYCTIKGNSATVSGGIGCSHSSPMIRHCMITDNTVKYHGAGVRCVYSDPIITHCTIAGNSAGDYGGGMDCVNSNYRINNCIIWDNSAPENPELITLFDDPAIIVDTAVSYSDVRGGCAGQSNIDIEPLFVDLAHGDYHLLIDSPCIDAGDPCYSPSPGETDVDGDPRVLGSRVDMGADEFSSESAVMRIWPTELEFYAFHGGQHPELQVLSIRNGAMSTIRWEIAEDCSWLEVHPQQGESSDQPSKITVSVSISGLDPCSYNCQLMLTSPDTVDSPRTVPIVLHVGALELHVPLEYPTIQAAIDAAIAGASVIVADGTYMGDGNRDIDFKGKAITVRSENGPANCVIDCQAAETDRHRGFTFHSGEDANSIITGFTITGGFGPVDYVGKYPGSAGGAVYCSASSPSISNCMMTGNSAVAGGAICCSRGASPKITNCILTHNVGSGGAIQCRDSAPEITNCVIADNEAPWDCDPMGFCVDTVGGGFYCEECAAKITNCTIVYNEASGYGGGLYTYGVAKPILRNCILCNYPDETAGSGAIVTYSAGCGALFAERGYLDPNGTPDDPSDDFYVQGDYHLKSQAGRWDPKSQSWVRDDVTSPRIDAGDPSDPIGHEPFPNGGIINMGAYGATAEASKSYFGEPVCETIMAGDINGDCKVDFADFWIMACHWLEDGGPQ